MRKFGLILLLLAIVLGLLAVNVQPVSAGDGKVLVCHATGSATNPYVLNSVSVNSVASAADWFNGHGGHAGDAWEAFTARNGDRIAAQGDLNLCYEPLPTETVPGVTPTSSSTLPTETVPGITPTATLPTETVPGVTPTATLPTETVPGVTPTATLPTETVPGVTPTNQPSTIPTTNANKDVPTCDEIAKMDTDDFANWLNVWTSGTGSNGGVSCQQQGYTYTGSESGGSLMGLFAAILIGILGAILVLKPAKRA